MKKLTIAFLFAIILSGCMPVKDEALVCYTKPPLDIPDQVELTTLPVYVTVEQLQSGKTGIVLDETNFANWLLNNKRIENYIRIDKQIIDDYKKYYNTEKANIPK